MPTFSLLKHCTLSTKKKSDHRTVNRSLPDMQKKNLWTVAIKLFPANHVTGFPATYQVIK